MGRLRDAIRAGVNAYRTFASIPEGAASQVDHTTPPPIPQGAGQDHEIGNTFTSYESQVQAIYDLYQNRLRYGCSPLRNVIRFRSAQTAGNGANFKSEHKPTQEFLNKWATRNGLTGGRLLNHVRLGEMEGKCVLFNGMQDGEVVVRALPWQRWRYQVNGVQDNGEEPDTVTYKDAAGDQQELRRGHFVYVKIGGASCDDQGYILNATTPPVASSLWRMIYIDRAISDLRDNNNLYARAVRVVEAVDSVNASFLRRLLLGRKTGEAAATKTISKREQYVIEGKMYYAEPSGTGSKALHEEIRLNAQILSGDVGVPVHYIGFPELMSNRSTAEDMHEMINSATLDSREAWKAGLTELAKQACILDGGQYEPDTITVSLPVVMLGMIKLIAELWGPLLDRGVVHKQTVREIIPGIDPEREAELDADGEARAAEMRNAETKNVLDMMRKPPEAAEDDAA